MSPRDLAHRSFWTERPLSQLYAIAHGRFTARGFEPARSWSVQQLIAFAEILPADVIGHLGEGLTQ